MLHTFSNWNVNLLPIKFYLRNNLSINMANLYFVGMRRSTALSKCCIVVCVGWAWLTDLAEVGWVRDQFFCGFEQGLHHGEEHRGFGWLEGLQTGHRCPAHFTHRRAQTHQQGRHHWWERNTHTNTQSKLTVQALNRDPHNTTSECNT